ncbi:MAG: T9SS type A sorting domain-containing protein [Bacteroidales bacterium]
MLFIEHMPLLGDQPVQTEYEIEAKIIAYSGETIINDDVLLVYQLDGDDPVEVVMTEEGNDMYSATLPGGDEGTEVSYYITAMDAGDHAGNHPYIGEYDPHSFFVGGQLFPAIALDVTEINAWVNEGYMDTEEFTISNPGELDLEYSIEWNTNIYEEHDYDVEDSPNAGAWNSNTFTELGWTEFEMDAETGLISDWHIDYTWQTDNWPEEGTFLIQSPAGTEATIAAGLDDGNYSISLDDFNGEETEGTWKLWITDSYGDGGHKATNINITVTNAYELEPWLFVDPSAGSIEPGGSNTIEVVCDGTTLAVGDYVGAIMVYSNDPDFSTIEIPVYFTVDIASETANSMKADQLISNYPNPFSTFTMFSIELDEPGEVELSVYDLSGRQVNTLVKQTYASGTHKISWNGENESGERMKSGIYFYHLKAGNEEVIKKLILID